MRLATVLPAILFFVTALFARAVRTTTSPPPRYTLSPEEAAIEDPGDLDALFHPDERPLHTTVLIAMARETVVAVVEGNDSDTDRRVELR